MKIFTIVGARPQFIKAATVSRVLGASGVEEYLVHTGQHFDHGMSEIFFKELGIPNPDQNLAISESSHAKQTGKMMIRIEELLLEQKPDCVLLYGDTNSTIAGALAASKVHLPIAHVEAGLRSFNREMPEEINRIVTDQLSAHLYTPSKVSTSHLVREGVDRGKIHEVGDVMYDGVLHFSHDLGSSRSPASISGVSESYVLATIHRAESTDNDSRIKQIFEGLLKINSSWEVVLPLHPRTRKKLDSLGMLKEVADKMTVIDPVGYLDMLCLTKSASAVFTDSGGLQKEAYYLKTPCVTCRAETEWEETIERGANTLVDPDSSPETFVQVLSTVLEGGFIDKGTSALYGGGEASERIVEHLLSVYG